MLIRPILVRSVIVAGIGQRVIVVAVSPSAWFVAMWIMRTLMRLATYWPPGLGLLHGEGRSDYRPL